MLWHEVLFRDITLLWCVWVTCRCVDRCWSSSMQSQRTLVCRQKPTSLLKKCMTSVFACWSLIILSLFPFPTLLSTATMLFPNPYKSIQSHGLCSHVTWIMYLFCTMLYRQTFPIQCCSIKLVHFMIPEKHMKLVTNYNFFFFLICYCIYYLWRSCLLITLRSLQEKTYEDVHCSLK